MSGIRPTHTVLWAWIILIVLQNSVQLCCLLKYEAGRRQLQTADDRGHSKGNMNRFGIWSQSLPPLLLHFPFPRSSPSFSPAPTQGSPSVSPLYSPSASPAASPFGVIFPLTPASNLDPTISPPPTPSSSAFIPLTPKFDREFRPRHHDYNVVVFGTSASILLIIVSFVGFKICQKQKLVSVQPWKTGLSGQLQKAFVTGVPKLKRLEIEAACEDFSNIIGTLSDGSLMYKGTLSSGVEIAVTSSAVTLKDWSKQLEAQFRRKVRTLSRINHKNFVNLLGFCEEEQPFTRMMVFEYAPNGSLFEHLHIKEAEHLNWKNRLKVAMGVAYCLEHMHQLSPPVIHENLQSSCIFLTEDYAAKVSELSLLNEFTDSKMRPDSNSKEPLKLPPASLQNNVYSYGLLLLELVSGMHLLLDEKSMKDLLTELLNTDSPAESFVDPTLSSTSTDIKKLKKLLDIIRKCLHTDPKMRPSISDVADQLTEVTGITPEEAVPKLSHLWWAELEIISTDE